MVRSGLESPRRHLSRLAALAVACTVGMCAALPTRAEAASQYAGVQSHVLWGNVSLGEMDRQLDTLKDAGAGMTRVDVGWASIEPDAKGRYDSWYLGKLDHLVAGAQARGIKLLLTFAETPCWASKAPASLKQGCDGAWWDRDVQNYAPRHASDYADALAYVVKRYGSRVAAWEIWNEPNQTNFFRTDDQVGDYADMVKAAYPAAKAADPGTTIVAGSLSDSDFEFTDALLRKGIAGHFDGFSVHPYSDDRSPLDTRVESPRYSLLSGVPKVRATMARYGEHEPIWLTEFGWSTCDVRGPVHWQNCVDPSVQAAYLRKAFDQIHSWSYVRAAIWFNLKNTTTASDDRVGNYGLTTAGGSRKPAFAAFRSVAERFAADPPLEQPQPGSGGPAPTPSSRPPVKHHGAHRRRTVVHVARHSGYVIVSGRTPRRGHARLLLFQRDDRTGSFGKRASYEWEFVSHHRGRFSLKLRGTAFDRGTWRIVVRPVGRPRQGRATVLGA